MRPLADRMRPRTLDEFAGQGHLVSEGKPLRGAIEGDGLHSMILWGPPGTGKTTLARLVANHQDAVFLSISAVLSGVKDIRASIETAKAEQEMGHRVVLFVDEVHRFNKSQQDAFLPHVEDGTVTFIGATTENPSFELNNALLSRARTYVLRSLNPDDLKNLLITALKDSERGLAESADAAAPEAIDLLAQAADGDARRALTLLEIAHDLSDGQGIDISVVKEVIAHGTRRFDKGGDAFYDQISALHKSVRGSDPDAALYWFVRMIDGGCDPVYVARRVVRMASEDIGNADPRGLRIALDAWETFDRLGSPEGELAIAQAVMYLACAPKSNAVYKAYNAMRERVRSQPSYEVPVHLRNAPTKLMKELGYGHAYRYAHDEPEAYAAGEHYFPDELQAQRVYEPVARGLEGKIADKLRHLRELDRQSRK